MSRFDLTEAEGRIIEPLLLHGDGLRIGRQRLDDRRMPHATFLVLRTGTPCRDLPERYGPHTTAHNRFDRRAKRGVLLAIFGALAARPPGSLAREHVPTD